MNIYCSHWLVTKYIQPIARQNKARQEGQTKNTERKGGLRKLQVGWFWNKMC